MFETIIIRPMVNVLVTMTNALGGNFGLAIIGLTLLVRLITLPLTMRQVRSTKAMQEVGPKLKEIQKTYAKDPQKIQQETMRLYREAGVNPFGCLVPMIIQIPIWIALYQSVIKSLGYTPEDLLGLSRLLYSWPFVHQAIPLNDSFLWLNLSLPDPLFIMPILVGISMFVQQKMTTPSAGADGGQQQQMNQMMLWMMPIMFAFFTLQFPSGLALYWIAFNVIGVVIQYYSTGWGGLGDVQIFKKLLGRGPSGAQRALPAAPTISAKKVQDGQKLSRDKRKNR